MVLKRKFFLTSLIALLIYSSILIITSTSYRNIQENKQMEIISQNSYDSARDELLNLNNIAKAIISNIVSTNLNNNEKKKLILKELSNINFNASGRSYGAFEIDKSNNLFLLFYGSNSFGGKSLNLMNSENFYYFDTLINNSKNNNFTYYSYKDIYAKKNVITISFYEPTLNLVVFTEFDLSSLEKHLNSINSDLSKISNDSIKDFRTIAIFMTIFIAFLASFASKKITAPVKLLRESFYEFSMGQLKTRSNIKTYDEIEDLSASFNDLADKFQLNLNERNFLIDKIDMLLGATIHLFNLENQDEFLSSIFHLIFDFISVDYLYANFRYKNYSELILANKNKNCKLNYSNENDNLITDKEALKLLLNSNEFNINPQVLLESFKIKNLDIIVQGKNYGNIQLIITNKNKDFQNDADQLLAHFYSLIEMFIKSNQMSKEMLKSYKNFAIKLALVAEAHDSDTGMHVVRVGKLAGLVAKEFKLPQHKIDEIENFAPLHDIGKIFIPKDILTKSSKLSEDEWDLIKTHTTHAEKILGKDKKFKTALNIAKYHHEKYDGSGYPYNLSSSDIPLEAQIVAIVDVYDALRKERAYKLALSHDEALKIILEGDGRTDPKHFNPQLLEIFKRKSEKIRDFWEKI